MRKALLSCLIPIVIFCISVGVVFFSYRDTVYSTLVKQELELIYDAAKTGLYDQDIKLVKVRDYCDNVFNRVNEYDFYTDTEELSVLLKNIVQNNECETAILCNSEGIGVNEKGKGINISDMQYFKTVSDKFGSGGSGIFVLHGDDYDSKAIACAYQVTYSGGTKGFLIVIIKTEDFSTTVFGQKIDCDYSAFVTSSGDILVEAGDRPRKSDDSNVTSIVDVLPVDIKSEAVERALTHKVVYKEHSENYGYIMLISAPVYYGTAVICLKDQRVQEVINSGLDEYDEKLMTFVILSVALVFLMSVILLFLYKNNKNELRKVNRDPVTGLLTKESAAKMIEDYIQISPETGAVMFIIQVIGAEKVVEKFGYEHLDESKVSFSKIISDKFRATDIVGYLEKDKYIIFVKNISEEKHIRKQIDDMLMFMYDFKNHSAVEDDNSTSISIGGAIYPKNGVTYEELYSSAEAALQKSLKRGKGLMSMYDK